MKLYATVTSERATKGQGGEWLDIEIMGHAKVVIARLKVRTSQDHGYLVEVLPIAFPDLLKIDVKGHGYRVTRKDAARHIVMQGMKKEEKEYRRCYAQVKSDFCVYTAIPDSEYCLKHTLAFGTGREEEKGNKQKGESQPCMYQHPHAGMPGSCEWHD